METTPAVDPCGFPGGGGGGNGGGGGDMMALFFPMMLFILIFYFLILRPQNKRKKEHEALLGGIVRGDHIITVCGTFGTVREVREDSFMIEIAEGVKVRVLKSAVQTRRMATPTVEDKRD